VKFRQDWLFWELPSGQNRRSERSQGRLAGADCRIDPLSVESAKVPAITEKAQLLR
jgi:hypothetical protein